MERGNPQKRASQQPNRSGSVTKNLKPETIYGRLLASRFGIGACSPTGQYPVWRDGILEVWPGESRTVLDDCGTALFTVYGPVGNPADRFDPRALWWVKGWGTAEQWPKERIELILAEGYWELGEKLLAPFPSV